MTSDDGAGVDEAFRTSARAYREVAGWSQAELANRMQERGHPWHQATVYKVEDGRRPVRLAEAVALADVLGAQLPELIAGVSDERRARFELAVAARRFKAARAAKEVADLEMREATEERDAAATRYERLVGLIPVDQLLTEEEASDG